jgi:ribosomal protein S18 acetylase RimI-like enzyme
MEHGALNLAGLRDLARSNLATTYLALGQATGGTDLLQDEGFVACLSSTPHPICNFAIDLHLDPWSVRRLASIAAERQTFFVYQMPSDRPDHTTGLLERSGFRRGYELRVMFSERAQAATTVELVPARTSVERLELAKFMTDQFFPRQNLPFRRLITSATAKAEELSLFGVWSGSQRVATLMLCDGPTLGIYNLCVHPSHRGLGWGTSVVSAVQSLAFRTDRQVTLQCEPRLEPWYKQLGFETIGTIGVYDLAEPHRADIIETINL